MTQLTAKIRRENKHLPGIELPIEAIDMICAIDWGAVAVAEHVRVRVKAAKNVERAIPLAIKARIAAQKKRAAERAESRAQRVNVRYPKGLRELLLAIARPRFPRMTSEKQLLSAITILLMHKGLDAAYNDYARAQACDPEALLDLPPQFRNVVDGALAQKAARAATLVKFGHDGTVLGKAVVDALTERPGESGAASAGRAIARQTRGELW